MKYLSVNEVAERLGNHEKTVRRYILNGDLQAKKIGGQWRIAEPWFEHFLKQGEESHEEHSPAMNHSEHDFCVFMDSDYFESESVIQTCTIIDNLDENHEVFAWKAKSKACDILQRGEKFKIEVRPHGRGSRIVMWGEPRHIQEVLEGLE